MNRTFLQRPSPASLWASLAPETRREAAAAVYQGEDRQSRREADVAIAAAIRFRETAVRQLPVAQRIDFLVRAVRADDALASTLLTALHFTCRRPLLSAFLDRLEIPHDEGMIDPDHEIGSFPEDGLRAASDDLNQQFPPAQVDVYLASLWVMDPESWSGLGTLLRQRLDRPANPMDDPPLASNRAD